MESVLNLADGPKTASQHREWLILSGFVVLPFASYVSLGLFGWLTLRWAMGDPRALWQLLYRQGWVLLSGGFVLTTLVAEFPGEAVLRLFNFLPFFLFWAGLTLYITRLPNPLRSLEQWALGLLLATVPINLKAMVEYGFYGQRASSVFGNPNVLAAYLVLVFGLGLGLCIKTLPMPNSDWSVLGARPPQYDRWIIPIATSLIPVGLWCSGSRNGILVAIVQWLVFSWWTRHQRWCQLMNWSGMGLIVPTIAYTEVGGRSMELILRGQDPRLEIWQLAMAMARQHPWLGSGLGSLQRSYAPYLYHAHNLWLDLAAEAGIPLALGLTVIVGWACFRAASTIVLHPPDRETVAVLAGYGLSFLACALFSMFDLAFFDARINLLDWMAFAVIQAVPLILENRRIATHSDQTSV